MFKALKEILFPKICLGCGTWGEYLCANCLRFIKVQDQPICPQCLRPSFYGLTHPRCQRPLALNGLTAVFCYQGPIKKAITKLKYQFVTDLAQTLIELFLTDCGQDKAFTKFVNQKNITLVPIPLHQRRKNWRGFNQAELLGKMIAQNLGIGFLPDLLIRVRETKPQIELSKKKRLENILGAFQINRALLTSHFSPPILLFDDVWTTGATIKEAGKVLKANHFSKVWGLTLAR